MKREELMVAAIENGTVIDHIPSSKLFDIVRLLRLEEIDSSTVMIGYNLKSRKMGHKSIIKIADRYFTDTELSQLAVVAPNVSLCIIRDYEVAEKKDICLSSELRGIVKCANPKCISNNEPMETYFHVTDAAAGAIRCHYCEKEQKLDRVRLVEQ